MIGYTKCRFSLKQLDVAQDFLSWLESGYSMVTRTVSLGNDLLQ